jgi:MFS family permease
MWSDIKRVWQLPGFFLVACAGALTGLAGYGLGAWSPSFLIRTHGLSLMEAGLMLGIAGAIGGILGAVIGGILCDRLSQRDLRWQLWLPSLGAFASAPFMLAFVLWPEAQAWSVGGITIPVAMVFMLFGGIIAAFWIGPTYAAIQNLAPEHQRTQASALFLFMFNLIGLGLGPLVIGILSDVFAPNFGTDSLCTSSLEVR